MGFFDSIIAEEETSTKVMTPVKTANKSETNEIFWNENDLIIIDDTPIIFNEQSVIDKVEELNRIENIVTFSDEIKKEEIEDEIQIEEQIEEQKIDIPELQDLNIVTSISSQISWGSWDDWSSSWSWDDSKKWDPNAILDESIVKLQKIIKWNENVINNEMKIIEWKQQQITDLKQEIKSSTENAKIIWDENAKIIKMVELFQSQKIS